MSQSFQSTLLVSGPFENGNSKIRCSGFVLVCEMPPLDFFAAAYDPALLTELNDVQYLREETRRFATNMNEVTRLFNATIIFFGVGMDYGAAHSTAMCKIKKTHDFWLTSGDPDYQNIIDLTTALTVEKHGEEVNDPDIMQKRFWDISYSGFDSLLKSRGEAFDPVFRPIVTAMILQTWTAIEVMIGDMHKAASNGRKTPDAAAKSMNKRILDLIAVRRGGQKGEPWDFKCPNLSSLDGAREAFAVIFSVDYEHIDESFSHEALDVLYRLRNQFVHEAGIITSSFKKYIKRLSIKERFRNKNEPLALTGSEARL